MNISTCAVFSASLAPYSSVCIPFNQRSRRLHDVESVHDVYSGRQCTRMQLLPVVVQNQALAFSSMTPKHCLAFE